MNKSAHDETSRFLYSTWYYVESPKNKDVLQLSHKLNIIQENKVKVV